MTRDDAATALEILRAAMGPDQVRALDEAQGVIERARRDAAFDAIVQAVQVCVGIREEVKHDAPRWAVADLCVQKLTLLARAHKDEG